jgi:hypothetical protein
MEGGRMKIPSLQPLSHAFCALAAAMLISTPSVAESSKPISSSKPTSAGNSKAYPMDGIPWAGRSRKDKVFNSSYDDRHTFKHQRIYVVDPFTWTVSEKFADMFRMPRGWIDDSLKGALAVAWRVTPIGVASCGYGKNPQSCWPALDCQLDMYFDSATPLPWNYTDVVRDTMIPGLSSDYFLPRLSANSKWWRYMDGTDLPGAKGPVMPESLLDMRYLKGGSMSTGLLQLWHFDREYEPGVVLLSYGGACPGFPGTGPGIVSYHTQEDLTRTRGYKPNAVHSVILPEAFVTQIQVRHKAETKAVQDTTRRLYEEFQQRQKDAGSTQQP